MARKKKSQTSPAATAGLMIALVAFISTILLGAAKGMIALQLFQIDDTKNLDLAFNISWPLIIVGLMIYAFMAPDTIRNFVGGRQARYGSNALIQGIAFLGFLLALNVLAFQNPDFLDSPWDMTEDRSNTLANETLQALEGLPGKVQATAFYSDGLDPSGAEELLAKFKTKSNGNFDYTFVNPDEDPLTARAAGITGDGKILLTMGERKEIASFASETELTRSLIRLINPGTRTVYFVEGHGEVPLEGGGELSMATAKTTLEAKNYTVDTINLASTDSIDPEIALAVIIAGPQKPLSTSEVSLLKRYVDAGGSLVVMEDPVFLTEFGDDEDPLAAYLQTDWGVVLNNDIIFDLTSQQALIAVSNSANPNHPITQNLSLNYQILMPQARSIGTSETPVENVTLTPLIFTSSDSWGETEISEDPEAQYQPDADADNFGPLTMAIAAENTATGGRVVVFGNSLFATDTAFDWYGNGNFFVNSVDWSAEQEDLINITPRQTTPRTMKVVGGVQYIMIIIFAILVLPGLIVFMGVSSWIARRRKG